jgi:hypothetical protein
MLKQQQSQALALVNPLGNQSLFTALLPPHSSQISYTSMSSCRYSGIQSCQLAVSANSGLGR